MKILILICTFLITSTLFAQNNTDENYSIVTDQAQTWKMNISSNPRMRAEMMRIIIERTKRNPEEMMQLVKCILSNSDLHQMILKKSDRSTKNINTLQMLGMMKNNLNVLKMTTVKKSRLLKSNDLL